MVKQKESPVEIPSMLSPEWNDYVLSLFTKNELIDGNPLTIGLRRVAELLVGEIISSKPIDVQIMQTDHPVGKTTVTYEVQFLVKNEEGQEYIKTFADVSDVWEGNTDDVFAVHAPATAATKAEGRALRKALKLRVVAAEELCRKDPSKIIAKYTSESTSTDERISTNQINYLVNKCKKLDIDLIKFINMGNNKYKSIYQIKKDVATTMIKTVEEMSKGQREVPSNITGFNEDWSE